MINWLKDFVELGKIFNIKHLFAVGLTLIFADLCFFKTYNYLLGASCLAAPYLFEKLRIFLKYIKDIYLNWKYRKNINAEVLRISNNVNQNIVSFLNIFLSRGQVNLYQIKQYNINTDEINFMIINNILTVNKTTQFVINDYDNNYNDVIQTYRLNYNLITSILQNKLQIKNNNKQ